MARRASKKLGADVTHAQPHGSVAMDDRGGEALSVVWSRAAKLAGVMP